MINLESSQNISDLLQWIIEYSKNRINSRLIDERRCIPPYIILDFGNKGLLGMIASKAYGGLELKHSEIMRILEQLGSIDLTLALFVGLNNLLGIRPIMKYASNSAKDNLLPNLVNGRELAAFALTEEGSGSNPLAMSSRAVVANNGCWQLYGKKIWSGSASWAGVINTFVYASDMNGQEGVTGFILKQGAQGLKQGSEALTMGLRGMVQNTLYLDGVSISEEYLLGSFGQGMDVAQDTMTYGRLAIAAVTLGSMKKCAQTMLRYASRRNISTGNLFNNPVTLVHVSETVNSISVLESLIQTSTEFLDNDQELPIEYYTICKIIGSEHSYKTVDRLIQLLGGRGFIETNMVPQLLRDSRIFRIFEGPTETLYSFLGTKVLYDSDNLFKFINNHLKNPNTITRITKEIELIFGLSINELKKNNHLPSSNLTNYIIGHITCYVLCLSVLEYKNSLGELTNAIIWVENIIAKIKNKYLNYKLLDSFTLNSKELAAVILNYEKTIGDIDQELEGENNVLDPLLSIEKGQDLSLNSDSYQNYQSDRTASISLADNDVENRTISMLKQILQQNYNITDIDEDVSFFEIGLDSIKILQFVENIESAFSISLEHSVLWKYDNVSKLSKFLLKLKK